MKLGHQKKFNALITEAREEMEETKREKELAQKLAEIKREEILREAQERTLGRSTRDADTEDQSTVKSDARTVAAVQETSSKEGTNQREDERKSADTEPFVTVELPDDIDYFAFLRSVPKQSCREYVITPL
jgi:hypothetical protein